LRIEAVGGTITLNLELLRLMVAPAL
jgi:hypothetical protein